MADQAKLGIIGRERAVIDKLTKLISDAVGGYHERTNSRHTDRGAEFEVRIFEGTRGRGEPTGHIARVTVELDRLEPHPDHDRLEADSPTETGGTK